MLTLAPGIALVCAAVLLVVLALGARYSPSAIALGAGPFRAMLVGAAVLAVLGGLIDWRHTVLVSQETGFVELGTWLEDDITWVVAVPVFALGMAILSVAVRQVLRRKVQGAAGWVGLVMVLGGLGLEESSGRLLVNPETHRLHLRRGALFARESEMGGAAVEEVAIYPRRVRGAPMFEVRLRGASLPEGFAALGYDSREAHVSRLEAERWSQVGGWPVHEVIAPVEGEGL